MCVQYIRGKRKGRFDFILPLLIRCALLRATCWFRSSVRHSETDVTMDARNVNVFNLTTNGWVRCRVGWGGGLRGFGSEDGESVGRIQIPHPVLYVLSFPGLLIEGLH